VEPVVSESSIEPDGRSEGLPSGRPNDWSVNGRFDATLRRHDDERLELRLVEIGAVSTSSTLV
jgi:hypothetical protein